MSKYLTVLLLFCLGKWWHQTATPEALRFLLYPTDAAVSAATGGSGVWRAGAGYYHAGPDILIDASCAGFNFLMIAFLMLAYVLIDRFDRWWAVPLALAIAWPVAVFANASRILTILLTGEGPGFISTGAWHQGQGVLVYFSVLVGVYFGVGALLNVMDKRRDHAVAPTSRRVKLESRI